MAQVSVGNCVKLPKQRGGGAKIGPWVSLAPFFFFGAALQTKLNGKCSHSVSDVIICVDEVALSRVVVSHVRPPSAVRMQSVRNHYWPIQRDKKKKTSPCIA